MSLPTNGSFSNGESQVARTLGAGKNRFCGSEGALVTERPHQTKSKSRFQDLIAIVNHYYNVRNKLIHKRTTPISVTGTAVCGMQHRTRIHRQTGHTTRELTLRKG